MAPRKIREGGLKQKAPSFEASFKELEDTVAKLEEGDLSLEDSILLYERGMALATQLEETLAEAELRVRKLAPASGEDDVSEEYAADEE